MKKKIMLSHQAVHDLRKKCMKNYIRKSIYMKNNMCLCVCVCVCVCVRARAALSPFKV